MEAQEMNLGDLKAILLRRRWALLLPAVGVFLLAVVIAFVLPAIYRSSATILIEEQEIPVDLVQTTVSSYAQQRLQGINQRIMSTSRLLEIIKSLKLYPELQGKENPDEIAAIMRKDIALDFIQADVVDPKTGRASMATIAFSLSYNGKDPTQTQKVASVLSSLFLEENLKVREKTVREASSFLEVEANNVKNDMAEIDRKIAQYKEEHINELPELLQVNMQSLQNTEMNSDRLSEQMRGLREREGYLQSQLVSIPQSSGQMQKNRLEELQVKLDNLKTRFSDQYPDVIEVKSEIAKIEKENKGKGSGAQPGVMADNPAYINLAAQLASTRSEISSLAKQITANEGKIAHYRKLVEATPRVEEFYRTLISERDNLQHKYSELRQKHMQAQVAQGLEKNQQGERFSLIEPPLLPEKPSKPNRLAIILIGLVLGLGAGVGTAAMLEFSDQSIRTPEALSRLTSSLVLVTIPEIGGKEKSSFLKRESKG
ncbi:MAG: lipopolysaccharide biosynthesis [Desulfobulbaceae bacterium]|nr:MAG: lipopolysaccharide biosynthesis [Desulfobulbaceae bacterium]